MEAYEDNNAIMSYPAVSDYSIDMRQLVYYFSRSYRNHCTSCVNRYMFSYNNDFLCIAPIRSQYRVLGRTDVFKPVKQAKYFDTYFQGSFDDCVNKFNELVRSYVLLI